MVADMLFILIAVLFACAAAVYWHVDRRREAQAEWDPASIRPLTMHTEDPPKLVKLDEDTKGVPRRRPYRVESYTTAARSRSFSNLEAALDFLRSDPDFPSNTILNTATGESWNVNELLETTTNGDTTHA